MTLHCAICLFTKTGVAPEAVTVISGVATCEDHMGSVASGDPHVFAATRPGGKP